MDAATGPAGTPAYFAGLRLAGRSVVAVGAGRVHARRIPALVAAGARVTVVAPALHPGLEPFVARGTISWLPREFEDGDLDGAWYVLAATDDAAVNARVAAGAEARHVFCVRADRADLGSAWTPATGVVDGALVGVLTDRDPRRAKALRDRLVEQSGGAAASPAAAGGVAEDRPSGEVILVGGGPGDPDLITVGGLRALEDADVVLYDHLAPVACLRRVKPGATTIDVSKIPGGRQTGQDEINALLVRHALAGDRVVRLKGGDPFVLGRGSEEWQACAAAGVPVRVIPGVSSSIAGPELAGIPLTHRGLAQDFTVVSGHVGPDHPGSLVNWDALARTRGTIVVLMGVMHLAGICDGLVARGLASDTPAAIVAGAATSAQRVVRGTVGTLAGLAASAHIEPPALTVIGAVVGLELSGA